VYIIQFPLPPLAEFKRSQKRGREGEGKGGEKNKKYLIIYTPVSGSSK